MSEYTEIGESLNRYIRATSELLQTTPDNHPPILTRIRREWATLAPALESLASEAEGRQFGASKPITDFLVMHMPNGEAHPMGWGDWARSQAGWIGTHAQKVADLERTLRVPVPAAPTTPSTGNNSTAKPDPVALAVALLKDHPEWSAHKLADQCGCATSTLTRSRFFKLAKSLATAKREPRRGSKDSSGTIEAIADED